MGWWVTREGGGMVGDKGGRWDSGDKGGRWDGG